MRHGDAENTEEDAEKTKTSILYFFSASVSALSASPRRISIFGELFNEVREN
jgi:hypothetical protein